MRAQLLSGDDILGRAYLENVWRRDWLNRRVSVVGQVQYVVQLPALAEHNHSADQKLAMHGLVPRDARPELDMRGLSGCRLWRGHKIAPADVDPAVVDFIRTLVITQQQTDIDTIQKQVRFVSCVIFSEISCFFGSKMCCFGRYRCSVRYWTWLGNTIGNQQQCYLVLPIV